VKEYLKDIDELAE